MTRIIIETSLTEELVLLNDIVKIDAKENYTMIYLFDGKNILSNKSLSKIEEKLNPSFCMCHKSHIVNINRIARIHKDFKIEMTNGMIVPLSRRRKNECIKYIQEYYAGLMDT